MQDIEQFFDQERLFSLQQELLQKLNERHFTLVSKGQLSLTTLFLLSKKVSADELFIHLDKCNIMIGLGSSCSAKIGQASPYLLNLGYSEEDARRGIRLSWNYSLTEEEISYLLTSIDTLYERY